MRAAGFHLLWLGLAVGLIAAAGPARAAVAEEGADPAPAAELAVRDLAAQMSFYGKAVGLGALPALPAAEEAGEARLEVPGFALVLRRGAAGGEGASAPLVIPVGDPVARRKALLDAGGELGPFHSPGPGVLAFDGVDPEGNPFRVEARVGAEGASPRAAAAAGAAFEDWIAAYNEADRERYLAFYADDPRLHIVEKGRHVYRSKGEVVEAVGALYDMIEAAEIRLLSLDVTAVSADLALAEARFEQRLVLDADNALDLAGRLELLMERGEAGWRALAGDTAATPAAGAGSD